MSRNRLSPKCYTVFDFHSLRDNNFGDAYYGKQKKRNFLGRASKWKRINNKAVSIVSVRLIKSMNILPRHTRVVLHYSFIHSSVDHPTGRSATATDIPLCDVSTSLGPLSSSSISDTAAAITVSSCYPAAVINDEVPVLSSNTHRTSCSIV